MSEGSSCHQCKNMKSHAQLVLCTHEFDRKSAPGKRRCRKKYCIGCLQKFYNFHPESQKRELATWVCASCRNACNCAACTRTKVKKVSKAEAKSGLKRKKPEPSSAPPFTEDGDPAASSGSADSSVDPDNGGGCGSREASSSSHRPTKRRLTTQSQQTSAAAADPSPSESSAGVQVRSQLAGVPIRAPVRMGTISPSSGRPRTRLGSGGQIQSPPGSLASAAGLPVSRAAAVRPFPDGSPPADFCSPFGSSAVRRDARPLLFLQPQLQALQLPEDAEQAEAILQALQQRHGGAIEEADGDEEMKFSTENTPVAPFAQLRSPTGSLRSTRGRQVRPATAKLLQSADVGTRRLMLEATPAHARPSILLSPSTTAFANSNIFMPTTVPNAVVPMTPPTPLETITAPVVITPSATAASVATLAEAAASAQPMPSPSGGPRTSMLSSADLESRRRFLMAAASSAHRQQTGAVAPEVGITVSAVHTSHHIQLRTLHADPGSSEDGPATVVMEEDADAASRVSTPTPSPSFSLTSSPGTAATAAAVVAASEPSALEAVIAANAAPAPLTVLGTSQSPSPLLPPPLLPPIDQNQHMQYLGLLDDHYDDLPPHLQPFFQFHQQQQQQHQQQQQQQRQQQPQQQQRRNQEAYQAAHVALFGNGSAGSGRDGLGGFPKREPRLTPGGMHRVGPPGQITRPSSASSSSSPSPSMSMSMISPFNGHRVPALPIPGATSSLSPLHRNLRQPHPLGDFPGALPQALGLGQLPAGLSSSGSDFHAPLPLLPTPAGPTKMNGGAAAMPCLHPSPEAPKPSLQSPRSSTRNPEGLGDWKPLPAVKLDPGKGPEVDSSGTSSRNSSPSLSQETSPADEKCMPPPSALDSGVSSPSSFLASPPKTCSPRSCVAERQAPPSPVGLFWQHTGEETAAAKALVAKVAASAGALPIPSNRLPPGSGGLPSSLPGSGLGLRYHRHLPFPGGQLMIPEPFVGNGPPHSVNSSPAGAMRSVLPSPRGLPPWTTSNLVSPLQPSTSNPLSAGLSAALLNEAAAAAATMPATGMARTSPLSSASTVIAATTAAAAAVRSNPGD